MNTIFKHAVLLIASAFVALALVSTVPAGRSMPPPSAFSARVDNPWFPLIPGTTYVYRGTDEGQPSRDVFTVTHKTRRVDGALCVVIDDRYYVSGRLAERTTDWYSQDSKGNVWYFGEATANLDANGNVTSTHGSWEAGRDGARAGIFMPAHPKIGQSFRQEFYKGHAEDHFRVVGLRAKARTPYVSTSRALLTKEWTPLEPGVIDHKLYVRGIGTVLEQTVKGGSERNVLVSVRRGG
jgi:hypothetical protein